MKEPSQITTSNLAIKAVCIVGFINATQMLNLIFSPMSKQQGGFYPNYFTFSVLASLICLFGLWFQKRWAAIAYIVILVLNQIILLRMGYWEISALVIPLIIAVLLFQNRALLS